MKKIHIVGKDLEKIEGMKGILKSQGFEYSEEDPDLVITYGGDGMFLIAERMFPRVPKVSLRDSEIGNKCCDFSLEEVLKKYSGEEFEIEEIHKLKAVHKGRFEFRDLLGANDIVIRNSLPTEAVRFKVLIDGKDVGEFIGDGIVVSTAYGSGGYFSSITGKDFKKGIGLAFNNIVGSKDPIFLSGNEKIEIEVIRGPAILVSDNNRDYINLENGDRIIVEQIDDIARRIILK